MERAAETQGQCEGASMVEIIKVLARMLWGEKAPYVLMKAGAEMADIDHFKAGVPLEMINIELDDNCMLIDCYSAEELAGGDDELCYN